MECSELSAGESAGLLKCYCYTRKALRVSVGLIFSNYKHHGYTWANRDRWLVDRRQMSEDILKNIWTIILKFLFFRWIIYDDENDELLRWNPGVKFGRNQFESNYSYFQLFFPVSRVRIPVLMVRSPVSRVRFPVSRARSPVSAVRSPVPRVRFVSGLPWLQYWGNTQTILCRIQKL